jgi:predicted DNA-binding transcriptional regulator YafY
MIKKHAGSRGSSEVLARAALIYDRLCRAESTRAELIAHVRAGLGDSAYGAAPEDSLRHDLDWLERLGFAVEMTAGHRYRLARFAPKFPIPLTREHVATLSAVRWMFQGTVYADSIDGLFACVRDFLTPNLRTALDRRPVMRLSPPLLDNLAPHETTLAQFRKAVFEQRRLGFVYHSPAHAGPQRHVIEPETLEEREGHLYFEGYSPDAGQVLQFRLERVEPGSAEVLPAKFGAGRKRRPIPIRYRLSPAVARFGATRRFENHAETRLEDGWVEVTAETRDLFWASKTLLKYGENCVVLEPAELQAEIRRVVKGMAENYGLAP